jgi:hypothetical protein
MDGKKNEIPKIWTTNWIYIFCLIDCLMQPRNKLSIKYQYSTAKIDFSVCEHLMLHVNELHFKKLEIFKFKKNLMKNLTVAYLDFF